jgi:hypothetical protein
MQILTNPVLSYDALPIVNPITLYESAFNSSLGFEIIVFPLSCSLNFENLIKKN